MRTPRSCPTFLLMLHLVLKFGGRVLTSTVRALLLFIEPTPLSITLQALLHLRFLVEDGLAQRVDTRAHTPVPLSTTLGSGIRCGPRLNRPAHWLHLPDLQG